MLSSQLLNLLRSHSRDPIVSTCLQAIDESEFRHGIPVSIGLERVLELYSIRARINLEINNNVIAGYKGLLAALSNAPKDSLVRIQSLELVSRCFIVFTDENETVLFGILDSPKEKAVWFDPVTGYDHD